MGWIFLDLFSQFQDVIVDSSSGREFVETPDLIEQIITGYDLVYVFDEILKNLDF